LYSVIGVNNYYMVLLVASVHGVDIPISAGSNEHLLDNSPTNPTHSQS